MPRYYCDYCDAYLTHDSMAGRQQHMKGWRHRDAFRNYYQQIYPQWVMQNQQQMVMGGLMVPGGVPPQNMPMGMPRSMGPPPGYMPPPGAFAPPPGTTLMTPSGQRLPPPPGAMAAGLPPPPRPMAGGLPPPMFRPPPAFPPAAAPPQ